MMKKYTLLLVLFCATQIHASEQKSPAVSPLRPARKPSSVIQQDALNAVLSWELAHNAPVVNPIIKREMQEKAKAKVGQACLAPVRQKNSVPQYFPNNVAKTLTFQF